MMQRRVPSVNEVPMATVLVVDDEPEFREIVTEWLTFGGYTVHAAKDGFAALAIAKRLTLDVVVTDLSMPGMTGHHLMAMLKELEPSLEVIFLTGEGTLDDAIAALREGKAFDFLQKPLKNLYLLNEAIERSLRRRRVQTSPKPSPQGGFPDFIEPLSEREIEVVRQLTQGLDNHDIAARLVLSEKTVKNHLTRIYEKLKVKNRTQAVMLAQQYGVIEEPLPMR